MPENRSARKFFEIAWKEISDFELLDVEGGIILGQLVKKWVNVLFLCVHLYCTVLYCTTATGCQPNCS